MEAPRAAPLPSRPGEKLALVASLLVYTFGCYYAIGAGQDPARARSLRTALDDAIPFVPAFMWVYVTVYTSLLIPVFTVRCQRLFRRVAAAYALVVTGCVLVWLLFPVSAVGLRADPALLDPSVFHEWGLRVNYALDPPLNLFPSLHAAIAVIAALACWTADRRYGLAAGALALAISASICFVKQHFVADGVAGAALAGLVYWGVLRPYEREVPAGSVAGVAYGWGGPAAWLGLHLSVLLVLKLVHLAGWAPWAP
ncbi:MAG: hypothetical protein D6731_19265 [Planctomycetota bacterium]|nr:MAG: hypothetical protein D6731_19265 [Planctomycetota bacterium]